MDKARKREREIAAAPLKYRGVLRRAYSGESHAAAIKARCLQCCGFLRVEVRNCTAEACALWEKRPYQRDDEPDDLESEERANP